MSDRKTSTVPADRWENLEALGRAVRTNRQLPRLPSQPGHRQRRGRTVRRVLVILLALLLVAGLAGLFMVYRYTNSLLGKGQQKVQNLTPTKAGKPTNILLVGSDTREGLSERELSRAATSRVGGQRTDTIILVHVSPRNKKAVMVSIPRDLKVNIPGRGPDKINAAFAFGGADLLVETIEQNFGIPVNHYAEINFGGFLSVVDALGGVRLCNDTGRQLDDRFANLHMPPGCHNMRGPQALAFVRARHIDSDFGRIGRQQQFMRAVMGEVSSKGNLINVPKMIKIANLVSDHVKTDDTLGTGEAISLVRRLRTLNDQTVDMRVFPSYAAGIDPSNGVSYVQALPEAPVLMRALANDARELPPVGLPNGKGISLRDLRLVVLNGGGVQGAAARAAEGLRGYGLRIEQTGNASKPTGASSTLAYPPSLEQQARLLSALLGDQVKLVPARGEQASRSVLTLTVGSAYPFPGAPTG